MKNERRDFIKNTAIAGIGLGLASSVFPLYAGSSSKVGGRIGIIGLDTSHVTAFTKTINQSGRPEFEGFEIVAAYPTKGSADLPSSIDRLEGFTKQISDMGVEIVNSIDELINKVDVVLLESVDGRRHLEEAIPVLKAGKRMFIDKPVAHDLPSAIAIYEAAEKYNTPVFSSSSTRFAPASVEIVKGKDSVGEVLGATTYGPAAIAIGHIDMANYGIHAIESLFTLMGTGCKEVTRSNSPVGDVVTGVWDDGRIGTFYATPKDGKAVFGGTVHGSKGVEGNIEILAGYDPMLVEVVKFFKTGNVPVTSAQTIEIFAFMEAADESRRNGGKPVTLASVMQNAKRKAKKL